MIHFDFYSLLLTLWIILALTLACGPSNSYHWEKCTCYYSIINNYRSFVIFMWIAIRMQLYCSRWYVLNIVTWVATERFRFYFSRQKTVLRHIFEKLMILKYLGRSLMVLIIFRGHYYIFSCYHKNGAYCSFMLFYF